MHPWPFEHEYPLSEGRWNPCTMCTMAQHPLVRERDHGGEFRSKSGRQNCTNSQLLSRYCNFIPDAEMVNGIRSGNIPPAAPARWTGQNWLGEAVAGRNKQADDCPLTGEDKGQACMPLGLHKVLTVQVHPDPCLHGVCGW